MRSYAVDDTDIALPEEVILHESLWDKIQGLCTKYRVRQSSLIKALKRYAAMQFHFKQNVAAVLTDTRNEGLQPVKPKVKKVKKGATGANPDFDWKDEKMRARTPVLPPPPVFNGLPLISSPHKLLQRVPSAVLRRGRALAYPSEDSSHSSADNEETASEEEKRKRLSADPDYLGPSTWRDVVIDEMAKVFIADYEKTLVRTVFQRLEEHSDGDPYPFLSLCLEFACLQPHELLLFCLLVFSKGRTTEATNMEGNVSSELIENIVRVLHKERGEETAALSFAIANIPYDTKRKLSAKDIEENLMREASITPLPPGVRDYAPYVSLIGEAVRKRSILNTLTLGDGDKPYQEIGVKKLTAYVLTFPVLIISPLVRFQTQLTRKVLGEEFRDYQEERMRERLSDLARQALQIDFSLIHRVTQCQGREKRLLQTFARSVMLQALTTGGRALWEVSSTVRLADTELEDGDERRSKMCVQERESLLKSLALEVKQESDIRSCDAKGGNATDLCLHCLEVLQSPRKSGDKKRKTILERQRYRSLFCHSCRKKALIRLKLGHKLSFILSVLDWEKGSNGAEWESGTNAERLLKEELDPESQRRFSYNIATGVSQWI